VSCFIEFKPRDLVSLHPHHTALGKFSRLPDICIGLRKGNYGEAPMAEQAENREELIGFYLGERDRLASGFPALSLTQILGGWNVDQKGRGRLPTADLWFAVVNESRVPGVIWERFRKAEGFGTARPDGLLVAAEDRRRSIRDGFGFEQIVCGNRRSPRSFVLPILHGERPSYFLLRRV